MKINVIGGGPAGMYFAIVMLARDSSHTIHIYERSPADVTWGWGVVFSSKTLDNLAGSDPVVRARLQEKLTQWTDVVMLYQKQEVRVRGNPFAAIARIEILKTLQERCAELGVHLHFDTNIGDPKSLSDCDLLVGADGVNSAVRRAYEPYFAPQIRTGSNKFVWLGTHHLFNGLTLGFVDSPAGPFACHAYRFCDDTSTFIAECTEETWRRAGLDVADEARSLDYLADIFSDELGGQPLLSNNSSWIQFREVKNAHWHHDNIVLLGDALHTAHFSIGSGTKLALEDAIALADCLAAQPSVRLALQAFEIERRPSVEALQRAAFTSQEWFENMAEKMEPDPYLFSYDCMTRSGRVDLERLREQDGAFVAAYEAALAKRKRDS